MVVLKFLRKRGGALQRAAARQREDSECLSLNIQMENGVLETRVLRALPVLLFIYLFLVAFVLKLTPLAPKKELKDSSSRRAG